MNKFEVYRHVINLQAITAQYPDALEISGELDELARQLSSRVYRVAVVGEFKRGKSSLVNCILGTQILPTDILPTTAVVNRIVYGTEQRVEILYKDGRRMSTTVDELAHYATKENAENAAQIREIIVYYPTVFCQNNIELLDTPGLNDDEFMDKTTLDVLDRIDTAIVATHAAYPISETEQELICRLLEQEDIYHLTFVATFIDQVSDEPEDQDRVVEMIRQRLATETYQRFCAKHPDEPRLLQKAERILCAPAVFAVSSRLAMKGFINGSKRLLEDSRFPRFKYELSALLTANQELDMQMKAARLAQEVGESISTWHAQLLASLEAELERSRETLRISQKYQLAGCADLVERLMQADREMYAGGVFVPERQQLENSPMVRDCVRTVLRKLLQLDPQKTESQYVGNMLSDTVRELGLDSWQSHTEELVYDRFRQVYEHLLESERSCGMSGEKLQRRLSQWRGSTPFPQLSSDSSDISRRFNVRKTTEILCSGDVVRLAQLVQDVVTRALCDDFIAWQERLQTYIASWRSQLLEQNTADKNEMAAVAEESAKRIRDCYLKHDAAQVNYNTNMGVLQQAEILHAVLP